MPPDMNMWNAKQKLHQRGLPSVDAYCIACLVHSRMVQTQGLHGNFQRKAYFQTVLASLQRHVPATLETTCFHDAVARTYLEYGF